MNPPRNLGPAIFTAALLAFSAPAPAQGAFDLAFPTGGRSTRETTGSVPQGVAIGDVDRDGSLDAIVSNAFDDTIAVLLGDGAGGFANGPTYNTGPTAGATNDFPRAVALADLNGDLMLDAIAVNSGRSGPNVNPSVAVLMGQADGNFEEAHFYPTGAAGGQSFTVTVGLVDFDDTPDLLIGNRGQSGGTKGITFLRGRRDGRFDSPQQIPITSAARAASGMILRDLDLDGKADVIVSNERDIQILRGNGDGSFQPATTLISPTGSVAAPALTDLDGDGTLDLIFVDQSYARVTTLLDVHINGTYATRIDSPTPTFALPQAMAVDDFDLDGILDVAFASLGAPANERIAIFRGDGTGAFPVLAASQSTGRVPFSLAVGQLTPEGAPDILTANQGEGGGEDVSKFLNTATPQASPEFQTVALRNIAPQAGPGIARAPGLGVDSASGNAWLCDPLNHRLVRLAPTGAVQASIDTAAFGCLDPQDVAVNPDDGHLFIAGGLANTIWRITAGGSLVSTLPVDRPNGLAIDPATDRLFVAAEGATTLVAMSLTGSPIESYDLNDPLEDLTFDNASGLILAVRSVQGRIALLQLDSDQHRANIVGEVDLDHDANLLDRSAATAVGLTGDRHLVATTDTGALVTLEPEEGNDWSVDSIMQIDTGVRLGGLAASAEAAVWGSDRGIRAQILSLDSALNLGTRVTCNQAISSQPRRAVATAVASAEIFCLQEGPPEVRVFNPTGAPIRNFPLPSMANREPHGIAYHPDRGTIFVLGDRRLVEVSRTGALLHTWAIDATLAQAALSVDPANGDLIALSPLPRRTFHLSPEDGSVLARRALADMIPAALAPRGLAIRPTSGNWVFSTDAPSVVIENAPLLPIPSGLVLL